MKTLTNIRNTEKQLKILFLIGLVVLQMSVTASEVPAVAKADSEKLAAHSLPVFETNEVVKQII